MSWLDAYRAGRHSQVWREMRQLGDRIREAQYLSAAVEVCDEMARRAKHNIKTLVSRLLDQGYRFHDNDDDETPCRSTRRLRLLTVWSTGWSRTSVRSS